MYAIIKTGGKQYKVSEGDTIRVEKLDAKAGDEVNFSEVMLVVDGDDIKIGKPLIEGAQVSAEVKAQDRDDKVKVIKFKRRKGYHRTIGHRQAYTELAIKSIKS